MDDTQRAARKLLREMKRKAKEGETTIEKILESETAAVNAAPQENDATREDEDFKIENYVDRIINELPESYHMDFYKEISRRLPPEIRRSIFELEKKTLGRGYSREYYEKNKQKMQERARKNYQKNIDIEVREIQGKKKVGRPRLPDPTTD